MLKRIQQVRLVHLQTIVFVLNWFPNGLGLFLYKIFSRLGWTTDYVKYLTPFVFLNYAVFILCPLSYVFLLEEIPFVKIFAPCLWKDNMATLPVTVVNIEENEPEMFGWNVNPPLRPKQGAHVTEISKSHISNKVRIMNENNYNNLKLIEMTHITTVGVTGPSDCLSFTTTKGNFGQNFYYNQCAPILALLTPTTSAKLKNIAVQLHAEPIENPYNDNAILDNQRNCETLI